MASVVTGAFGYIGRYIARHLLELGEDVRTITTHPAKPNPFGHLVKASSYHFREPEKLTSSLRGASTLYNTYWVRFEYGSATFRQAVRNTVTLFDCAKKAGIEKIAHISVTHASDDTTLPYYKGKALQERALVDSGVPYCVVRPTLVFGQGDILVNNIAWLIRRFPIFPIFGNGRYLVQPLYAEDLAAIAVAGARERESRVFDAIGPETFTFKGLVQLMVSKIKPETRLVHVPPWLGIASGRLIGIAVRDIILTRDELKGLMDNKLTSDQAANGQTRFSDWLEANKDMVGTSYSSELAKHFRC